MNIFVAAHYNLNNGDRAVLDATIDIIKNIYGNEATITVSASSPEKMIVKNINIVPWPIKRNILAKILYRGLYKLGSFNWEILRHLVDKEYLNALRRADVVLISGGHHLTDILGLDNFYSLMINYLVPIYMRKKIYLLPQSLGPISTSHQKELDVTKYILKNSVAIAYRDNSSEAFLRDLGCMENAEYVPDTVFSIEPKILDKKNKNIGVALYCSYVGEKKEKLMPKVLDELLATLKQYRKDGYDISFISMDPNDVSVANSLVDKLLKAEGSGSVKLENTGNEPVEEIISLFTNKTFILAYKTHSVVFSLISKTPVIAIAYHPKSIEFMNTAGLGDYAIFDHEASQELLESKIEMLLENREQIIAIEKDIVLKHKENIYRFVGNIKGNID